LRACIAICIRNPLIQAYRRIQANEHKIDHFGRIGQKIGRIGKAVECSARVMFEVKEACAGKERRSATIQQQREK
jgi:hypothetical protein